jgi:hypothetical protein
MPAVPDKFARITPEEIEEWGYLGVSENIIFNLLQLNEKQRKVIRATDKWRYNYNKGLARREIELAKKLTDAKDPTLIKELLKSTTITEKKFDNVPEIEIDAPDWIKPIKRRRRRKDEVND